jgi:hypothetical protein
MPPHWLLRVAQTLEACGPLSKNSLSRPTRPGDTVTPKGEEEKSRDDDSASAGDAIRVFGTPPAFQVS